MAGETNIEEPVSRATELCIQSQSMIDITADKLFALRAQLQSKINEELIQNEILESESKLIKMISRQLVAKAKLKTDIVPEKLQEYPKTDQWFKIVGIDPKVALSLNERGDNLESLLVMNDDQRQRLMQSYDASRDDVHRLNSALRHLSLWTESQLQDNSCCVSEHELHWSIYKAAIDPSLASTITCSSPFAGSPKLSHHRPSASSLPPEPPPPPSPPPVYVDSEQVITPVASHRFTPPPTPPLAKPAKGRFPTTPPPKKRNKLYPDVFHPLSKSKSHESQLSMKVNQEPNVDMSRYIKKKPDNLTITGATSFDALNQQRKRSMGDGSSGGMYSGQMSPLLLSSPKLSPPYKLTEQDAFDVHPNKKNQLAVPVSPNTPILGQNRSMGHSIKHGFQTKLVFGACDFCHKHVLRQGKVCKFCKRKFHRDCASKAAPTCGLPEAYLDAFIEAYVYPEGSPGLGRNINHTAPLSSVPLYPAPDSGSTTSSCTSSNPSSPALFYTTTPSSSSAQPSPHIHITGDGQAPPTQFHFPDSCTSSVTDSQGSVTDTIGTVSSVEAQSVIEHSDVVNTNTSNDSDKSDKTLIDTGGTDSGWTMSLLERTDSVESTEDGQSWHRVHSISVVLKEWYIPFEELVLEKVLGTGRFAVVYKGNWHGDVAIKMLNMDLNTDSQLTAFKLEVAVLRKTRHENLVLFMGACMRPPHLAIVTSLCKGSTLYNFLHLHKEKMPINRTVIVASQIAQGMGYLHAKNIVHKDLKSKNIFLEAGKVIITDFGLFNATQLCEGNRKGDLLIIPLGWLCYLAPEIMRSLQAGDNTELPFTDFSDVYAFGTVWYELLIGEWPFRQQPPEAIIWQVGKGIKQAIGNLQASRDVKELLIQCWSFKPSTRPDFGQILRLLERLPKKRLVRSPSHPVQLSRSAESVF